MKFRKKPVVIEARQFTGEFDSDLIVAWMGLPKTAFVQIEGEPPHLCITTLEGVMQANVGDWIIKGVKGEFYPCKPDIFEATYEPLEGK